MYLNERYILNGDNTDFNDILTSYLFFKEYGLTFFKANKVKGLFPIGSPKEAIHLISGLNFFIFIPIICDSSGIDLVITMSYLLELFTKNSYAEFIKSSKFLASENKQLILLFNGNTSLFP